MKKNFNQIDNIVILAAHKNDKLEPVGTYLPNALVKISKEVLLERNIEFLHELGHKNIIVITGYLSYQFDYLVEKYGITLIKNDQYINSSNLTSLVASTNYLSNTLVLESNLYFKSIEDLKNVIREVKQSDKSITFSYQTNDKNEDFVYDIGVFGKIKNIYLNNMLENKLVWSGIVFLNKNNVEQFISALNEWNKSTDKLSLNFATFLLTSKIKYKHICLDYCYLDKINTYEKYLKLNGHYTNLYQSKLFTPGPISNYPEIADLLGKSTIHHRFELFSYYVEQTVLMLKKLFQTKDAMPYLITCSATGLLEATAINLLEKNDKVLSIVNGEFGNRFKIIATELGCNVDVLEYQDGQTYDINEVIEKLKTTKYKALLLTWLETSTGVLNDISAISKALNTYAPNTLFLVDSVSALVNHDIEFDKNGIDVAFATSGKGFSVMPGLSVACVSKRAYEVAKNNKNFKFYFDFVKYQKYYDELKSTPFTPATSIIMALYASLSIINEKNIYKIRARKQEIFDYMQDELEKLGFKNNIAKANRTLGLLVLDAPENINTSLMRNSIEYRYNFYIELGRLHHKEKQVRIGIPNTITLDDAKQLIIYIKEYINNLKKD
ncbi:aminotransferase class V-fold PLP-dependent enzyme [Mycoplasmopsis alligatoris]|nr:aminotransferase class V-fold PLP-dependent enzyme [Mycoplasmopsis alligatoris]